MKKIAILGPTASGKTDLALTLAQRHNAYILSIDSLSVYKEIDIASAKPNKQELETIRHFGIDVFSPNQTFSVIHFFNLYLEAVKICEDESKNMIIVGGSSFYLKSLIEGISELPDFSEESIKQTNEALKDLKKAHQELTLLDPEYMSSVSPTDRYRLEKLLLIHYQTHLPPSLYFKTHQLKKIAPDLLVFEIAIERAVLRERITLRTSKMVEMGIIDEVAYLEKKYGRLPNSMKAIGIIETLEYLDNKISKEELISKIATHTSQLAKRQQTFNRTQFSNITRASALELESLCAKALLEA